MTDAVITKPRIDFVDCAKAIAIILMVFMHTTMYYPSMTNMICSFHMAVFFVVGGMFSDYRGKTFGSVLVKGIWQLIVPYFIFSILALSVCWISPTLHPELYFGNAGLSKIFKSAVIGMFLMEDRVTSYSFMPCGPLWFLVALFWCRILFWIWLRPGRYVWRALLRVAILALCLFISWKGFGLFSLSSATTAFPLFVLGYYTKDLILRFTRLPGKVRLLGILVLLAVVCIPTGSIIQYDGGLISGNPFIAYLRGFSGTIMILVISTMIVDIHESMTQILVKIGACTLLILGIHGYFIIPSKVLYSWLGFNVSEMHWAYAILVSLICVMVAPSINARVLKHFPMMVGKRPSRNKMTDV